MTGSELIAKYESYVDDTSSLSSAEELALLNKIYHQVIDSRPWSFLIQTNTADNTSTSVPYVAVETDFKFFSPNYVDPYTDELKTVVFVGTNRTPYEVIPFFKRNNYINVDGKCYYDAKNRRIYFTKQPTAVQAIEYDYVYQPTDLTTSTSPVFDSWFHDVLYHGMCADYDLIQQTEKGMSYRPENLQRYNQFLSDMTMADERIKDGR